MSHDSPLNTYNCRGNRSRPDSFASSSYDPIPIDIGSFAGVPLPEQAASSVSGRSDEVPFFERSVPNGLRPLRRRQTHSAHLAFFRWWIPEILASILSICAILAIAIVLKVYDGRGLDDLNLPSRFTLNGLIAAIATFDRVFLIVPVGSAISQEAWLWFAHNDHKVHPRSRLQDLNLSDSASRGAWGALIFIFYTPWRWLTLFGCVISILSLTIGTFTQQLIAIENIPIKNASSPLNPGNIQRSQLFGNFSGNPAEGAFGPLLNMKAAIYNGLMPPDTDAILAPCPSGNCTFPPTPSLAVCGDCISTTYTPEVCNSTQCNYTTPSGGIFQMENWTLASEGVGFVSQVSYGYHFPKQKGDTYYIANFETLGTVYGSMSGTVEGQKCPDYAANECALWFCVNTYNTTISNGKQTQTIISSNKTPNASKGEVINIGSLSTYPNMTYQEQNYTLYWLAYDALSSNLDDIINGTVLLNSDAFGPSSDITEAIWFGTQSPQPWIRNIALSMSNVVRTGAPQSDTIYDGTGYQLGIKVRWWWLSLPSATVASSILLLIIVMVRTSRSDISAWKGSPLTFLLFEVDNDIRRAVTNAGWTGIASGIEKSVGRRRVALKRKEGLQGMGCPGAWVFRSADETGGDSAVG